MVHVLIETYSFFAVLVDVAVIVAKALWTPRHSANEWSFPNRLGMRFFTKIQDQIKNLDH